MYSPNCGPRIARKVVGIPFIQVDQSITFDGEDRYLLGRKGRKVMKSQVQDSWLCSYLSTIMISGGIHVCTSAY